MGARELPEGQASIPLAGGSTVDVYAADERWNPCYLLVPWRDDVAVGVARPLNALAHSLALGEWRPA